MCALRQDHSQVSLLLLRPRLLTHSNTLGASPASLGVPLRSCQEAAHLHPLGRRGAYEIPPHRIRLKPSQELPLSAVQTPRCPVSRRTAAQGATDMTRRPRRCQPNLTTPLLDLQPFAVSKKKLRYYCWFWYSLDRLSWAVEKHCTCTTNKNKTKALSLPTPTPPFSLSHLTLSPSSHYTEQAAIRAPCSSKKCVLQLILTGSALPQL